MRKRKVIDLSSLCKQSLLQLYREDFFAYVQQKMLHERVLSELVFELKLNEEAEKRFLKKINGLLSGGINQKLYVSQGARNLTIVDHNDAPLPSDAKSGNAWFSTEERIIGMSRDGDDILENILHVVTIHSLDLDYPRVTSN